MVAGGLLVLLAVLPAFSQRAVPAGRIFYAPLDGSLDATEAMGSKHGEAQGKPVFVPGHHGQGLEVGDLDGPAGVDYQVAGNFHQDRGTLSMWVQPVNWRGDDGLYHLLFNASPGDHGFFLLYKHYSPWGLTFIIDPDEGPRSKMYIHSSISSWLPGQWHHVACTWGRYEGMFLYVDGKLVASSRGAGLSDKPLKPTMSFGSDWQGKGSRTVIDEVMIFNRRLAGYEIAQLAGLTGQVSQRPPAEVSWDVPGVVLAQAILSQKVLARVQGDALGATPLTRAELTLLPAASGQAPGPSSKVSLHPGLNTLEVDTTNLPFGRYTARLRLLSARGLAATKTLEISKETNDTWQTARQLGKTDRVLPPFTPLEMRLNEVTCYGRRYRFGRSGLADEIASQGQELLAAPMRVVAHTATGTCDFTAGRFSARSGFPTHAWFSGSQSGGGLTIDTSALARYEGTVWFTLHFRPDGPREIRDLRLEIPVKSAVAKYLDYVAPARVGDKRLGYGLLPAGKGVVWSREFLPSLWLGTEDLGLGWYAESDQYWDIDGDKALTIERRGNTAVLCMNIIRHPRRVTSDFTIQFGLQATPVRPLEPNWRSYQWVPSVDITSFFLNLRSRPYPRPELSGKRPRGKVCYLYGYQPYFTNTLPRDPDTFRKMVSLAKSYGLLGTPYTDTTFLPEDSGDYLLNPSMRTIPAVRGVGYGPVCNIACCHRGPFGDWFVWYVSHLVRKYGCNGIYLDEMWPCGCSNPAHGCGYVGPDGKRRVTYPLRARMETYRRIREVLYETGRPFWISDHISGGRVPPLPTFGDCLLLGEERNPDVRKNPDYTTNTTSAEWLAGFSPAAWGIPVAVIPQFKMSAAWMKDPDLAAKFLAAVVPQDLMIWPVFIDTPPVMAVRQAMAKFGIGSWDVTVLPYWHEKTGLSCAATGVRVTGYLRPGKLLVCAGNETNKDNPAVVVTIDAARLGLPAKMQARDAMTGEQLSYGEGKLQFSVPAGRLRLIELAD